MRPAQEPRPKDSGRSSGVAFSTETFPARTVPHGGNWPWYGLLRQMSVLGRLMAEVMFQALVGSRSFDRKASVRRHRSSCTRLAPRPPRPRINAANRLPGYRAPASAPSRKFPRATWACPVQESSRALRSLSLVLDRRLDLALFFVQLTLQFEKRHGVGLTVKLSRINVSACG